MSDGTAGIGGLSGLAGASGVPGGPHRGWIFAVIGGALPAALLAAMVAVPAALWSRLPGRVADHWTLAGTANGSSPRLAAFAALGVAAVLGACLVGLSWAVTRNGARVSTSRRGRAAGVPAAGLVSFGLFLMAISAASVIMVAVANLGGRGPGSASVGAGGLVGIAAGPLLLAFSAGYALRRYGGFGAADSGTPQATLGLRPGERAVWTGRARAGWAGPVGVLLVAAGAVAGTVTAQWVLVWPLPAVGIAMLAFTSVRVTVAARGVTVGYGVLGLRLTRIPLRRIASAAAVEQTAFAFGYRGSLLLFGAALVAVRRGPALRLTLRDGKLFTVAADDAATGAALLNDLISGLPEHGAT